MKQEATLSDYARTDLAKSLFLILVKVRSKIF